RAAKDGNPKRYALPRPMLGRAGADFSFSGLKTAVRQIENPNVADVAASFQAAVIDIFRDRVSAAMAMFREDHPGTEFVGFGPEGPGPGFVVAGGVASNAAIRGALTALCAAQGFDIKKPPPRLCTDNAAMVAWAGVERGQLGLFDGLGTSPRARWPLDAP